MDRLLDRSGLRTANYGDHTAGSSGTGLEQLQVINHDTGCHADCFVRLNASVCPNFQSQLVIIGNVTNTSIGNAKFYSRNRRINGIHRNHTNRLIRAFVLISRNIAQPLVDGNLHIEFRIFVQGSNMQLRIQNLYVGINKDVCCSNFLLTAAFDT